MAAAGQAGAAPRAQRPAGATFDLVLQAVAGSALGSSGAPYTLTISVIDLTVVGQPWPAQILHQDFDTASGWTLSGVGPDYQCTQTVAVRPRRRPRRPAGRPHPPVHRLADQPRRPDRLDHPQPPFVLV